MADLIDKDELKESIRKALSIKSLVYLTESEKSLVRLIDFAPTVDAVPVRHGRWIEIDDGDGDCHYECSVCGEAWVLNDGTPADNNMNFCPRCGAEMDGGEKDE